MTKRNIITGVDIGSTSIRTVIVEESRDDVDFSCVIGVGEVPSRGLRKGAVVDMEGLSKAIGASVEMAEQMAGVAVATVTVSLGGYHIRTQSNKGVIRVARADLEVTSDDIDRVIQIAGNVDVSPNHEVVHVIPLSYRLDDQDNLTNPVGMKGMRLETEAFIIEGFSPQIKNLLKCLHFANLQVEEFVFSPLAATESVLDHQKRELGVALVDIGTYSTGVAIFEEGDLLLAKIIPIGSGHITNDIAIGLRSKIETAEQIKILYGNAIGGDIDRKEEILLEEIDVSEEGSVYRYHVAEIIDARLEEMFEAINVELKSVGREGLLPAGVVLVGGGAKLHNLAEFAKKHLKLPVTIGYPRELGGLLDKVDDPSFVTATGLIKWYQRSGEMSVVSGDGWTGRLPQGVGSVLGKAGELFRKFMP